MQVTVKGKTVSTVEVAIFEPADNKAKRKLIVYRDIQDVLTELGDKLRIILPEQMNTLECSFTDRILLEGAWPCDFTIQIMDSLFGGYDCAIVSLSDNVKPDTIAYATTPRKGQEGAEIVGDIAKYTSMLISCNDNPIPYQNR